MVLGGLPRNEEDTTPTLLTTEAAIYTVRRPVVEVELSPGFTQLEPDYDAPVELVHIATDGTTSIGHFGDLRMV